MARFPYPDERSSQAVLTRTPVPLNVFRMLAHAPAVAEPAIDLGVALLSATSLPARLREAVILSVAGRVGCAYEQAQHTPVAERCGMTPEQTAATVEGTVHIDGLTEDEEVALAATGELVREHTLDHATVSALRQALGERQAVELIMLTGYYVMLANLLNALEVDSESAGDQIASAISELSGKQRETLSPPSRGDAS
ncbi:carboxymuconolactone decarboxylase family protein [Streptomyces sp. WAC 04229]|uniref:carboxymuconolactone decarboxylase family protein n=1 Tax=Streptomyces sp. WAC 04229 TaxID=2203206 RepID=UPI000F746297|nr:carboxymuconolactone decarboxylase family protein [Streptomyces sp. WAC 04229]RSN64750.1 carboxymuconolactone decarboxylase family protein [Streptomyces sp. WAC 04229]